MAHSFWLILTHIVSSWLILTHYGSFWLILSLLDSFCLILTHFDSCILIVTDFLCFHLGSFLDKIWTFVTVCSSRPHCSKVKTWTCSEFSLSRLISDLVFILNFGSFWKLNTHVLSFGLVLILLHCQSINQFWEIRVENNSWKNCLKNCLLYKSTVFNLRSWIRNELKWKKIMRHFGKFLSIIQYLWRLFVAVVTAPRSFLLRPSGYFRRFASVVQEWAKKPVINFYCTVHYF